MRSPDTIGFCRGWSNGGGQISREYGVSAVAASTYSTRWPYTTPAGNKHGNAKRSK
jgi:hypothetical protein